MTGQSLARAQWASRRGFVLAALGAAIGLGNIWRFSYVVGHNGGAVFLLIYLVTLVLVGLPLLLAELAIGRATQREAASAFHALGRRPLWRRAGLPGVLVSYVILTYYAVIAGWALKYFAAFAALRYPMQPGAAAGYFLGFITASFEPLFWQAAIMGISVLIVAGGIERGIERSAKFLMPLLGAIVMALAIHSLTLPGSGRGLAFLFAPRWEMLDEPAVYLAALGQAFFSLGLAMGVLVTYGSYLPRHHRLPAMGFIVAAGDTLFALIAAIVIFPAIFSFGMAPDQGPGLAFITLPEIFARMSAGGLIGMAFFGLLVVAAVTSLVALIEIPAAYVIERHGLHRKAAVALVALSAFALGVPSSLGFGELSGFTIAGHHILDAVDYFASNILLPLSGLAIALFAGWHWRRAEAALALGFERSWLFRLWHLSVRFVAPAVIAIIFLRALSLF